jgi:hypothetical protein
MANEPLKLNVTQTCSSHNHLHLIKSQLCLSSWLDQILKVILHSFKPKLNPYHICCFYLEPECDLVANFVTVQLSDSSLQMLLPVGTFSSSDAPRCSPVALVNISLQLQ